MAEAPKRIAWRPHTGAQERYLASQAREVLYGGARGGGKSQAALAGALRYVHVPGYRALILRRTFPELRELMDRAHEVYPQTGGSYIASEKRWRWASGATVEFGYCETHVDAMQYQGQEFHYIVFDEIGNLPEERTWLALMGNLRNPPEGVSLMARCTANPGGPGHGWLRKRFILPCPHDGREVYDANGNTRAFFPATVYDNPSLLNNDPAYVKYLEALPEVMRQQWLFGNWEVGTGLAFESLTETSHTEPPIKSIGRHWQIFGAFDWGFGHRWAFLLMAMRPDGSLLVIDSVMGRRQIPSEIADRVGELLKLYGLRFIDLAYTVAGSDQKTEDRARGNWGPSIREQFAAYGWFLIRADQARVAGYQNVLMYLHTKRLKFCQTPTVMRGIDQMMGMVVDPDSPNDILKVDVNETTGEGGDDWMDALRYGCMSRPMQKIVPPQPQNRLDRLIRRKEETGLAPAWKYDNPKPAFLTGETRTKSETIT